MSELTLYDFVKASYGIKGKSIELVSEHRVAGAQSISRNCRSKDGLQILNQFCKAYPMDITARKILHEVESFEKNFGDGTSLLTMLLVHLTKVHNNTPLLKKNIEKDINKILDNIKKQKDLLVVKEGECVQKTLKDLLERWVKTVCKRDPISEPIYTLLKENPCSIIGEKIHVNMIDRKEEIMFNKKSGFHVRCYANRRYISSLYSNFTNADIVLIDGALTEDQFKKYEQIAMPRRNTVVICKSFDEEIEQLINKCPTPYLIVLRYMTGSDEGDSELKKDLRYILDLQDNESEGCSEGKVEEVIVDESGVFFKSSIRDEKEVLEYVKKLAKEFNSNDIAKGALAYRIKNLQSNNKFDIYVNASTETRRQVIFDMIDDVFNSKKNIKLGMIKGGMSYMDDETQEGGQVFTAVKLLRDKLVADIDKDDDFEPVDLLANTIKIYEIVKNYLFELIDTYEVPIVTTNALMR